MKTAILLSGGVDSSVALCLLKKNPEIQLQAFYLKIWLEEDMAFLGDCPWEEDLSFVKSVCKGADVPLEIIPLQQEYHDLVIDHAIKELKEGRTPSPDILCNNYIKFGAFFNKIDAEFEKVATGHYAQLAQNENGEYSLKRSPDPVKDQTYFLYRLNQEQLSRALFPIGHLSKQEVRRMADQYNLPNKSRKDSQGLCFLGKIKYDEFVKFRLGVKSGKIIEIETGKEMGTHNGYWFFTIGQRQGLGLSGGPWYVVDKDIEDNIIFISHQNTCLDRSRQEFLVHSLHWISGKPKKEEIQLKVRHGPRIVQCSIAEHGKNCIKVKMEEDDPGIAPGQSAIFYEDQFCLGGGIIEWVN